MDEQDNMVEQRRAQAAQWFARLKTVPVSKGTLDAFFEWRRDPANAEAFAQAEQLWSDAGRISARPAMLRLADEAMARSAVPREARWFGPRTLVLTISLLAIALSIGLIFLLRGTDIPLATRIGEQRTIALADGSRLQLNTDTRIGTDIGSRVRRVRLEQGEALFEVAHDRSRPFLVSAGDVEVRATGTKFDVRHIGGHTVVTLFEGGVDILVAGTAPVHLRPGEEWQSSLPGAAHVRQVDPGRALAWTQGRILFDAVPLGAAVAEINRYTERKILLASERHASDPISGSFKPGDPASFVKAVSALLPLRPDTDADGVVTLRDASRPD